MLSKINIRIQLNLLQNISKAQEFCNFSKDIIEIIILKIYQI